MNMNDQWDWELVWQKNQHRLPWIVDEVQPSLIEHTTYLRPKSILELGCGDGLNTNWLHCNGYDVYGIDKSATAIHMAKQKFPLVKNFFPADLFEYAPDKVFDFVFDRGCFQCFNITEMTACVQKIYSLLENEGHWLSIIGKHRLNSSGPPQYNITTLAPILEKRFDIQSIKTVYLLSSTSVKYPAWEVLCKK